MKGKTRYNGLTRRQYKREKAKTCSTPGKEKDRIRCQATPIEKAIIKYPRSHKVYPELFQEITSRKNGK